MISELDLRRKMIAYLKQSISLDEFEDWLVANNRFVRFDSVGDMIADIELWLSEYSDSHISIGDLRKNLADSLRLISASFSLDSVKVTNVVTANSTAFSRLAPVEVPA